MKKWILVLGCVASSYTWAQEQPQAAVYRGVAQCEFNTHIGVYDHPQRPGSYIIQYNNQQYEMERKETTTGAVRLENTRHGLVWLQIPTKSMLLNTRLGQRIADQCINPEQRQNSQTRLSTSALGIQR